jgi:hypothetical protein
MALKALFEQFLMYSLLKKKKNGRELSLENSPN